jgi:hypothetical protein
MAVANPNSIKNNRKNHFLNPFEFLNSDGGTEERDPRRTTAVTIYILEK